MTLPHGTTGSLRPAFSSARAVALAVKQASTFTLYDRLPTGTELAFALLRYSFGGDRPSQTTRLAVFPARIHGIRVR